MLTPTVLPRIRNPGLIVESTTETVYYRLVYDKNREKFQNSVIRPCFLIRGNMVGKIQIFRRYLGQLNFLRGIKGISQPCL